MLSLLERMCKMMNMLGVPYMLSGSVAMNIYAEPRTNQDIDIIVEMLIERYSKFDQAFRQWILFFRGSNV